MQQLFPFGPWTPDQPKTVATIENLWALPQGYRPVKAFSAITPALSGLLNGCAYVASDGTAALLAGTPTELYRYSGTSWSSVLGSLSATSWRFDQFQDLVIGATGGAPVKFNLATGAAAALGGSPPSADLVATVRDQVFLAGDPAGRTTLSISGFNNPEQWTAGTNQSLEFAFPSGGEIMGLCGGETGVILQKNSIKRAIYTGDVTVWQFDEISRDIGCMAKGSVAQAGSRVFFLSEQGFKMTDRNSVADIGAERVDRTFFARHSRADIENIRCAIDPRTTTVTWAMPGSPGALWSYNWQIDQWSYAKLSVKALFRGFTANISLDALDALYPSGLDSIPVSLDSDMFSGGNPLFLIADQTGAVGALSGSNIDAVIGMTPIEPFPGRRVRMRGARADTDAVQGTVNVDVRARAGDAETIRASGAIRDNGRVPLRANGRHVGMTLAIPSHAWSYVQGMELEFESEGTR